ncbi:MAG: phage tail protein [Firmicutes bacterium HGW-Firmicutes-15]|nr:MAG: phage tail protein [Firmicutes bacterium HGW-Firmicutes-15]
MNIVYSLQDSNPNQSQKIYGVAVGVVTNINDPEKIGRVKVKFLLRESEQESDWIRIASPMAGPERGFYFLPEVNDEVLLAFHQGNVEEPFIIGALWNSQDKPPEANPYADGKVNVRKIKTSGGNEIIFTDEKSKEKVEIHTPKGKKILFDDENKKIELKDDNGKNTVTIDTSSNSITIQADSKVTIKVKSCNIEVDGSGGISINAPTSSLKFKANQIEIEASTTMDIKANATMNVKAGAMMKIEGAMVKIN